MSTASAPLPRSFWLGFVVPWLMATLALGAASTWVQVAGRALRETSIALLLGWPLAVALVLWGAARTWRAARVDTTQHTHRERAWRWAAQAVVVAGLLSMAAGLVFNFGVQARTYLALAAGADPLGQVVGTTTPEGHRLRLTGPLGMGDASRVLAQIDTLPGLRLLELDVSGGRVDEARRVAQAVVSRGLQTRVVGVCSNACVLVYAAGKGRQLSPDGRLGFHRLAPASINPVFGALTRRAQAAQLRSVGLPANFITNMLATPPGRLWHPETDELVNAGLVGVPGRPLDIDLPGPAGTPVGEYEEALRTHWIWQRLDTRHTGSLRSAATRMAAARDGGASDEATQVAGQGVIEALMPRLLADAGPGLWDGYARLLPDQLLAAAQIGPSTCLGVLTHATAARRSLPKPLPQREADWLASVLSSSASTGPSRRPTALEREVMRLAMGERAVVMVTGLLGPSRREGSCAQATALLSEVSALPAGERHLAQRFMFGPR